MSWGAFASGAVGGLAGGLLALGVLVVGAVGGLRRLRSRGRE